MAYHTNTRRVFDHWARAAMIARNYGYQTGLKHRIRRTRNVWRVERTDKPVGPFGPPWARHLGQVRMTINLG